MRRVRHPANGVRSRRPAVAPLAAVPVASPDYPVVFPDVLEISVHGKPDCSGRRLVYPDGRIDLGGSGSVLAEGCTAAEVTRRIAEAAGVPAESVVCRVAEARSRFIYVLGPGTDRPRAVSYTGPEHVTQFLQRAGGIATDARPTEVRVVRRNVARGIPSETFRVDLAAVRMGDANRRRGGAQ